MNGTVQGLVSSFGRLFLCTIFLMSAVGNKIPNFQGVADYMGKVGVPLPQIALAGAILFLIVGSISVIVGYQARIGAVLLSIFLVLATFYFHNFWAVTDAAKANDQMIQFMKNLSMLGAMLFIVANGPGAWSFDACSTKVQPTE